MHRDTQIGLAMSIVLIGFAAALCFPRDAARMSVSDPALTELRTNLAELPVRVYAPPAEPATPSSGTPQLSSAEPVPPAPTVGNFAEPSTSLSDHAAPDPVTPVESVRALDTPQPSVPPASDPFWSPAEEISTTPEQVHVVESGDTLSGLAQKYLGSVARYPEIFEANRDLLDTPDDLKLGMPLRIPAAAALDSPRRR